MTDIEISNLSKRIDIESVADVIGVKDYLIKYGNYMGKIDYTKVKKEKKGKLILVTSINPTPYGEGKTTISIGLHDALRGIGKNSLAVLREPSLGPVFGIKGGATGGGYAQVVPMEDINLHFTGDFHAITSANNLIASAIDNHIYFGNELNIDINKIVFKRCLDINDRALREVTLNNRKEYFQITAASEIMSILCLSKDFNDLKKRLGSILLAYNKDDEPIYARDLKLEGALATILKEAIKPNLVQTLENNPVIIHGGPFANIAHGCNSVIATTLGLKLADYVVTEAGFGSDLGAEKFFDIKCRSANLVPNAVVIVVTTKALKHHGGASLKEITEPSLDFLEKGLANLEVHIENMLKYTANVLVTLNKYDSDTDKEIDIIRSFVKSKDIHFSVSSSYKDGGEGAISLARQVVSVCEENTDFKLLYQDNLSLCDKIERVCLEIYHAGSVNYSNNSLEKLNKYTKMGYGNFPVCIAKTQYSISDDATSLGYPKDYEINIEDVSIYTGAKFVVVYLGSIMTMPGLSRCPNYENIDINNNGKIKGLF